MEQQIPRINSVWLHRNKDLYQVDLITNRNISDDKRDEYPLTVVYHSLSTGEVYSKEVKAFLKNRVPSEVHQNIQSSYEG